MVAPQIAKAKVRERAWLRQWGEALHTAVSVSRRTHSGATVVLPDID